MKEETRSAQRVREREKQAPSPSLSLSLREREIYSRWRDGTYILSDGGSARRGGERHGGKKRRKGGREGERDVVGVQTVSFGGGGFTLPASLDSTADRTLER